MKDVSQSRVKEYFWSIAKKMTNNFSNLTVQNLGNGYIKCLWKISTIDSLRIKFSKSCFYAIRLFDVSNNRNKTRATCIMKEIQVSKFQSSISFPIPINKGVYYFEFGYRKRNAEWRLLAHQDLNLGYRIKRSIEILDNDEWFLSKRVSQIIEFGPHEKAYKLSLNKQIGGSEEILDDKTDF